MPVDISSTTIEFHRFGGEADSLQKGRAYIRTCGYQRAADQVEVKIEPKTLRLSLNRLRYGFNRTVELEAQAQQVLRTEAENFLPVSELLPVGRSALHQIDIVTHASELRAYPFEAIYADAAAGYLQSATSGTILTRRIRSEFSYTVPPWPEVPSILFVHAQVDHDLAQSLIDEHRRALSEALAPWGSPADLEKKMLLLVREIDSVEALKQTRALANFSYIHILAHGARVAEEDMEESETEWGLRLGRADAAAASPKAIAEALKPINDLPLVVTLAACDSGAADRPELGNSSLVETLHRNGIPVVVASQFPLTKPGSVTLTKEFYRPLLSGADVRVALHAARVALRQEARAVDERRHDWLSLVGYVRLPAEGYSQYLRAFGLRVQLHILEAARKDAERLFEKPPAQQDEFDRVEGRLRERIAELLEQEQALVGDQNSALRAECAGLLASANKSLAEVRFVQAMRSSEDKARREGLDLSRTALEASLECYSQTYRRDPSKHWHGIQKLALEAALHGRIDDPLDLRLVQRVAESACVDEKEYWACGTVAEAILLGALTPEGFDLAKAKAALNSLQTRSATDAKDNGFAARSTRRQLQRYVSWWTKANGYFPERESDISEQAQQLVDCLRP
jgi:hypothetical protein